jgi:hypothetical protein
MWLGLNSVEFEAVNDLENLPDRAAAIVAATILEAALESRLRAELPDLKIKEKATLLDRMFSGSGPIATFSSQINLGYMLKIYDESAWRDMDRIRGIRNDFAHETGIGSFSVESVRDRCFNLKICDSHFSNTDANPFVTFVESVCPENLRFSVNNLEHKLSDPKQRYLLCIMYYTTFFAAAGFSPSISPDRTTRHTVLRSGPV